MKVKVSVALEKSLVARVDRVADAIGAKRSGLVQKWIERQIEEAELLAGLYGNDALRIVHEHGRHLLPDVVKAVREADGKSERPNRRSGGHREKK